MPQAKTKEEVREEFLRQIKAVVKYWATTKIMEPERDTIEERCDGVAFSILNIFDGTTAILPALNISLDPHADDKDYYKKHGEKWYKRGMIINNDVILHHEYCNLKEQDVRK